VNVFAVPTRVFRPPHDDLPQLLATSLPPLQEGDVVAVSSKIVSIGEGRCVPEGAVADKDELIRREAGQYLEREAVPGGYVMHTLTRGVLAPSAGIDASNAAGHYILWPSDPTRSARRIWRQLRAGHGLRRLGVIVTDSRSAPLRRGVLGFALAHWGFRPLRDYRGRRDVFGRRLRFSQANLADALGAVAVLAMGEGAEQTPLAVIRGAPGLRFVARPGRSQGRSQGRYSGLEVAPEEDLYWPFLRGVPWRPGGQA
jgi:dihydrofolate synthase / folylpolyglutamate synthase